METDNFDEQNMQRAPLGTEGHSDRPISAGKSDTVPQQPLNGTGTDPHTPELSEQSLTDLKKIAGASSGSSSGTDRSRSPGATATRQAPGKKKFVAPNLISPADKWKSVYTLNDALKGVWEKPTQVIGNLLLAQSALLISAHPHSMKSLAFLQAALEAVARKKVWGHFPTPNVTKTLFIETEDPPWLVQERIRGLAKGLRIGEDEDIPGFSWICPGPFDLVKDVAQLAMLLEKLKPDFAVISTLQNIIPGRDLNEQKDMAAVNKAVIELARKYCPIVMITHSTWDKTNKRAIGSITQTANYATTLHFEKKSDHVNVTLDSKIGSDEEEFVLELATEEVLSVGQDGSEEKKQEVRRLVYKPKQAPKKAKVIAAMKDLGESASAEQIASKAGVSDRYVRKVKADKKTTKGRSPKGASNPAAGDEKTVPPSDPPLLM